MTGTTPAYGFPYPDPTDRARGGSLAVRALAESVEGWWPKGEGVVVSYGDSAAVLPGPVAVDFPGARDRMVGFTFDGTTLTRTGARRNFLVIAEVELRVESSAGAATTASSIEINANGTGVAGSYDNRAHNETDQVQSTIVHSAATVVTLTAGDYLTVTASASHAGTVRSCTLRCFPIGPVE